MKKTFQESIKIILLNKKHHLEKIFLNFYNKDWDIHYNYPSFLIRDAYNRKKAIFKKFFFYYKLNYYM